MGIAEGHAVTFSAGLAKGGMLPFCNIYSSFMQRAYDNIIHDVALPNLNVVLCLDRAGLVGNDGATHHGLIDLAYLRPIPNMSICAPRVAEDLRQAMYMGQEMGGPLAIRYPRGRSMHDKHQPQLVYGKGICLKPGKDMAVLTLGAIGNTMIEAIQQLEKDKPVSIAHYDMRWLKPIDEALLHQIGKQYSKIITLEEGLIEGGLGSAVLEFMADNGYHPTVIRLGVDDQFVEHGSTKQLYEMLHLDKKGLCESLLQALEL